MNRLFSPIVALTAAALLSSSAMAHHSAAPFDFSKVKTTQGKVKEFKMLNPHVHATIAVTDAKGTRDVAFEGVSASIFYRAGYTRGAVNPGDTITFSFAPRKDGKDGGHITGLKTPAGKDLRLLPPTE